MTYALANEAEMGGSQSLAGQAVYLNQRTPSSVRDLVSNDDVKTTEEAIQI